MKNLIPIITHLIFLLSITNYLVVTEARHDPVLDTDGDELRAGTSYFIRPLIRPMGGGVRAVQMNGICEFAVAQENSETEWGEPVVFFPQVGDSVEESTDLNIGFHLSIGCRPSIWKVGDYDESTKQNFIILGGVVGNPGKETVNNWFKIEKMSTIGYKIVFRPRVCDSCVVSSGDVGVYFQNGVRRLALSEIYLPIQFHKARFNHKEY